MTREEAIEIIRRYECNSEHYEACEMAIRALEQEPKTGHWIDTDEKSAVCSCCNRNNTLYGDFCKWCGAKMVE